MIPDGFVLRTRAVLQQYSQSAYFLFRKQLLARVVDGVKAGNSSCKQAYIGVADFHSFYHHIIPMPGAPIPAGAAGAASLISATRLSVVSSVEATLVAF